MCVIFKNIYFNNYLIDISCVICIARTVYQKAGVQYIIDSVVKELLKDPARRFI